MRWIPLLVVLGLSAESSFAQTNWPSLQLHPVVSGLGVVTDIQHPGDGSGRLFICELGGRIRVLRNGVLKPEPFLDITDRVRPGVEDEDLYTFTFPPNYSNSHFYVASSRSPSSSVIQAVMSRFQVTTNYDVADTNSEEILLVIDTFGSFHQIFQLEFDSNGYMYVGCGDGGPQGDLGHHAQNPDSLRGKIMRLDTEGEPDPGKAYAIPTNNPYANTNTALDEIWALGVRSPWKFTFDTLTGEFYFADVGQDTWEEINVIPAPDPGGQNYGWRRYEGTNDYVVTNALGPGTLTMPVYQYSHAPNNRAITGGYVYRGDLYPRMRGIYFFADFWSGIVWGMQRVGPDWVVQQLLDLNFKVITFGQDQAGNLYLADSYAGRLYHLADSDSHAAGLGIREVSAQNGVFTYSFPTVPGRTIQPRYCDDLLTTNWTNLGPPIPWNGSFTNIIDLIGTNTAKRRFYQAVLLDI